jgi:hypothetical protein
MNRRGSPEHFRHAQRLDRIVSRAEAHQLHQLHYKPKVYAIAGLDMAQTAPKFE